jgi:ribosome biogenesis GTPase
MTAEESHIKLADLGYNEFFNSEWKSMRSPDTSVARVIAEHKEAYRVKNAEGEYLAKITGQMMFNAEKREDYPAVGDWVVITAFDEGNAVIHDILPRKTMLRKKYSGKQDMQIIATNLDVAFIVESLDRDYNLNRFERYLVLANEGGIEPVIVLNKTDLVDEAELKQKIEQINNRFPGVDVISASAVSEKGLDAMMIHVAKGRTCCFIGSSGVGKSSLINRMLSNDVIKTGDISAATGRGRHTTTAREMYLLNNGGIVIDNPGTREVGVADASSGLDGVFDDITSLAGECRYADCTHTHEPGCAVLLAVERNELDKDKYRNYIKLRKENDYYEMTDLEKRRKDREFGKFIKNALEDLKKLNR